jgi:AraC-like DNA-binding protein
MNPARLIELAQLIDRFTAEDGRTSTILPGVSLFKATHFTRPLPEIYRPVFCVIAQGSKQVTLYNEPYSYRASQFLLVSVDLPMICQLIEASPEKPYLLVIIDIDPKQIAELLFLMNHQHTTNTSERGLLAGDLDDVMGDSVLRLVQLLNTPDDIPILANQYIREIYYRLLRSPCGSGIAKIALKGSQMQRIATAISKIKTEFNTHISVDSLADLVGMSVSSFHAHFKAVTAMSPLQYQKSMRLINARNIMLARDLDAAKAAYEVGYESTSQFSREYARMFGKPPATDLALLRQGK